ncbi:MAG: PEP-CTERM sorting domain-containing protein [Planctomycetota bacterium]
MTPLSRPAALGATALSLSLGLSAHAVVLVDYDFDNSALGPYADGSVVDGGGPVTSALNVGSGNAGASAPNNGLTTGVDVVNQSLGDNDLRLTKTIDNFVPDGRPFVNADLAGVSTDDTGNFLLTADFSYTRLSSGGGEPLFQFLINTGDSLNAGLAQTIIQVEVANGILRYRDGNTNTLTGLTLDSGVEYLFDIDVDFSSDTQDTWSFKVATAADPNTLLVNLSDIDTRVANGEAGIVLWKGGANPGADFPTAFGAIDDLLITAIPEPGSLALAAMGLALVSARRR